VPELVAPLPDELRPVAERLFGDRLDRAEAYAELLATEGVIRGLIGPREAPRIWDRHILNCVAIAPLVGSEDYVVDVGSGAGLPGIVLAIASPGIGVVLIEPLARRTVFLEAVAFDLGLDNRVQIVQARAEEVAARPTMFHVKPADVVTARAVAPLDRLAGWCLPLTAVGGRVLAMKGASAPEEIEAHRREVGRLGGSAPVLRECVVDPLVPPTYVVEFRRDRNSHAPSGSRHPSVARNSRQ
jgi:16S rRNA (guanine527-N7)-methyltransferase